jgi:tetratricopeptide (TPR) repeat protein
MKRLRLLHIAVIGVGCGLAIVSGAVSPTAAFADEALRPEVGKPLQEAGNFLKQRKFKEAAAAVHTADSVPNKTATETFKVQQMNAAVLQGSGDLAGASRAYEGLIASGRISGDEQLKMIEAVASFSYQLKDYAKAITWSQRYLKEGGGDPAVREMLTSAYFAAGNYAEAAKDVKEAISAEEKSGRAPSEAQLQLLLNCYIPLNDKPGQAAMYEKLVTYYPKKEYWQEVIHKAQVKPGFSSDRMSLDVARLQIATGNFTTTAQYMETIQLALQAESVGEAKALTDKGFSSNVLGQGNDAARQNRLKDLVMKTTADDQAALADKATAAKAAPDGTAMVSVGMDYVGYKQFDKGIPLIEQGIAKGGLKHPDEAKLHLGYAYLQAGQKPKAIQAFKSVQGTDGAADLARLWLIYAGQKTS